MCIHQSIRDTVNVKTPPVNGTSGTARLKVHWFNDAALLIIIVQCTEHSMRTATSQHTSSAGCFYLTLTREMNPAPLISPFTTLPLSSRGSGTQARLVSISGTHRSCALMMPLWGDTECGKRRRGYGSAAPGQEEDRSTHFRSHLWSETRPRERKCCGRNRLRLLRKGRGNRKGCWAGLIFHTHTRA